MPCKPLTKRLSTRGTPGRGGASVPARVWAPYGVLPEPSRQLTAASWRPPPSLGHVYWRCLFSVSPFSRLQDTDRTKRVVTDHQWSWLCSGITVALGTSFAELTTANMEWMAGSTPQIKRGLCNCLLNPWQDFFLDISQNIPIFTNSKWRILI